ATPSATPSSEGRRLSPGGWFGLALIALIALLAAFAPLLAQFPPERIDLPASWQGPGPIHWLGTGDNGIDMLSQVAFGARISLWVGLTAVLLSGLLGTLF